MKNYSGIDTLQKQNFFIFKGLKDIAEILISKGADQNVKNDRGLTPYDLAVENRNAIIMVVIWINNLM